MITTYIATPECTTGEGVDAFEGNQAWDVDPCAQLMARDIVANATLVTPNQPPSWRATVDAVAAIEETFEAQFSNEAPSIDPSVDLSLVRARDLRRVNGLWTFVMTKAITEAENIAHQRLVVNKELVTQWLQEREQNEQEPAAIAAVEPADSEVDIVELSDTESTASDASDTSTSTGFDTDEAAEIREHHEHGLGGGLDRSEAEVAEEVEEVVEDVPGGAGALNESVPWEDYHADPPADVVADAEAAGLSLLDQNKLNFLANHNIRLQAYAETGERDEILFEQLTLG